MGIPHTYYDGNPEDRAYIRDFWTWLEQQPQQAWLYYARKANRDEAGDTHKVGRTAAVSHPARLVRKL